METDLDRLLGDHEERKMMRTGAERTWQYINELIYPDGTPPWANIADGGPTRTEIFDGTGEDAADTAAAAIHAMLTNPATRWFDFGLFDELLARDTDAGTWLWRTTTKMLSSFRNPSTLFNLANDEDYKQYVCIGNGCMHVESRWGKLPLHRAMPMAKVWWDENADGVVDTVGREFELTARAAFAKWGDKLPEKIRNMAGQKGRSLDLVNFLHVNMPRQKRDPAKRDRSNMEFRSVYICLDEPAIIIDGGSHELEYVCTRGPRRAGERYGRGFGHKALADVEMLQKMTRTVLMAAENTVEPSILAPDDGITGTMSFKNRAINYVRSEYLANGAAPRAFNPNTRVDIGLELLQDRRELVRRSFLKQLLEINRDPRYTATHVLALDEEQKRGLSPLLGRLETERLGPLIARNFNILRRMPGVFDPAPPEIQRLPMQPVFDSPAAKAMRLGVARSIAQGFENLKPLFDLDPAVADNFNLDEAARALGDGTGMPALVMAPIEVRDRVRAQRQQLALEKQQLENTKDLTVSAKNVAPFVKAVGDIGLAAANAGGGGAAPAEAAAA